ncbi:hypothetical protein SOVF_180730 [Spinacia oleracea]|uniref:Uncharacterized protein At5g01610 n=1 Tax=Spinacia oleracea TaxID=3562 RepID=A0A9R0J6X3_SPIOL|nr:uncharacterized protein At5g01610-like [Spinacia oleracea]KNA06469.1 hypothetical protein SOVF_180730 [Spinacia oleracea]
MSSSTTTTVLLLFILSLSTATAATSYAPTAYEILKSYDFPAGLLPTGVTGYELDRDTGKFKVFLPETCKFSIEGYDLEYKSTITGVISSGRLYKLKGISVKVLLLWLNIVEVDNKHGELQFSVGIMSANFPVEGFEESPSCGCGFDCNGANLAALVSSS